MISNYMCKRFGFSPGESAFRSQLSPSEADPESASSQVVSSFPSPVPLPPHSFPTLSPTLPRPPLLLPNAKSFSPSRTSSTDTLLLPSPSFTPSPQHQLFLNPTNAGEEREYVAMMSSKGAGLGRSLVKDMYCNGSWDVFGRLSAIVPHGGTLGCVSLSSRAQTQFETKADCAIKLRTILDSTTNTSHGSSLTDKAQSFKVSSDSFPAQESPNSAIAMSTLDSCSNLSSSPSESNSSFRKTMPFRSSPAPILHLSSTIRFYSLCSKSHLQMEMQNVQIFRIALARQRSQTFR